MRENYKDRIGMNSMTFKGMKKIFTFIFIFCVLVCSCSKEPLNTEQEMVTISFEQVMVTGNPMVRSESNEFLDIIKESTPTQMIVTLKNLDLGKTFTCKSNESISIPVGNYEISATGSFRSGMIFETPNIKCDSNMYSITASTHSITLSCYYDCYAIFALIDECKACYASCYNSNVSFYKKGKYYIGYFDNTYMEVILTPYDNNGLFSTTYKFSTTYIVDKIYAEYGKYYVIHPTSVDKSSTSFNIELLNMVEGEI